MPICQIVRIIRHTNLPNSFLFTTLKFYKQYHFKDDLINLNIEGIIISIILYHIG